MRTVQLKDDEFVATEIIQIGINKAEVMKALSAMIIARGNEYKLLALLNWEYFDGHGMVSNLWTRIAILEPTIH